MHLPHIKQLIPAAPRAYIGRHIRNLRRRPHTSIGNDFITDVCTRLKCEIAIIFDVGAHIGITALEFSDRLPEATVYAFEPSAQNFRRMAVNLVGKPDIRKFQIGFGEKKRTATLFLDPKHPSMARLIHATSENTETIEINMETVEIETIDTFCLARNLRRIDLLKVDTEGHELQVLAGASNMLKDGSIGVIKAECAIDPDSVYHTQLHDLCEYLHAHDYRIFGIYEQSEDTLSPGPRLRRFDVAFISPVLYSTKT
jgi:FkbM family methyltransferase